MNSVHEKGEKNQGHGIQLSLNPIMESAKEGLLALAVQTGLQVFQAMLQEELTQLVGPKGKHNPHRKAVRHGVEQGSVVMGGRKVRVDKPRVRSMEGEELHLQAYEAFQDPSFLTEAALERMIHGLSTRHYAHGLEPAGVDGKTGAISKSTISRRFVEGTKKKLAELLERRLDNEHYLALMIDGVVMADHTIVVALGIDETGKKHILGLWEGQPKTLLSVNHFSWTWWIEDFPLTRVSSSPLMGAKPFVPPYGMYSEKQPLFSDAKCIS